MENAPQENENHDPHLLSLAIVLRDAGVFISQVLWKVLSALQELHLDMNQYHVLH